MAGVSMMLLWGCGPRASQDCVQDGECAANRICVDGRCVNDSEQGTSDLELSAERLEFDRWTPQTESVETLELSNVGSATLHIERIALIGASGRHFRVEPDVAESAGIRLDPGQDPIEVQVFYVGGEGTGAEGTLAIETNDPEAERVEVALIGDEVPDCPRYLVADVGQVTFDRLLPSQTASRTVRVTSIGTEPFDFWRITGGIRDVYSFEFVDEAGERIGRPDALAPGEFVDVRIDYEPQVYQSLSSSLNIESSADGCGSFELRVDFGVDQPCTDVDLGGRESIDFGVVPPNRDATREFYVNDCGVRTGEASASFEMDDFASHFDVRNSEDGTVYIDYVPTEPGIHDSELVLTSNDPVRPEIRIPIMASADQDACSMTRAELIRSRDDATLGNPAKLVAGESFVVDASSSTGPFGSDASLSYDWERTMEPSDLGRFHLGFDADDARVHGLFERPGVVTYKVRADDLNGYPACNAVEQVVEIAPPADFYVELLWETPDLPRTRSGADLDLYMRRVGDEWDSAPSVYWDNVNPDWGVQGDASDDPSYEGTQESDFEPEVIEYPSPQGTVQIGVHDYDQMGDEVSEAIVRAYYNGDVVYERVGLEFQDDDFLTAFEISFDTGAVRVIDETRTGVGE
jgi:hypothetical protein